MSQEHPEPGTQAFITLPGEGDHIQPFGIDLHIVASTEQTGGRLSALAASHRPGEGPPDHMHLQQEEVLFVIEGTYEFTVDGATRIAGPGSFVYVPRNTVHSFRNIGNTVARMLDLTVPGGQDHYFREIAELAKGDGFTGERIHEISERYDTHFPGAH